MTGSELLKFRDRKLYLGEYFVALTIPKDEHPHVVPCASKVNPDGSYRLVFNVLYAKGDVSFAVEHGRRILAEHPTWKAGIYRAPFHGEGGSIFMAEINR